MWHDGLCLSCGDRDCQTFTFVAAPQTLGQLQTCGATGTFQKVATSAALITNFLQTFRNSQFLSWSGCDVSG